MNTGALEEVLDALAELLKRIEQFLRSGSK